MSIDARTGKIIQNRQRDKIQFQTSFTDFPVFVIYCKCIKECGSIHKNDINRVLGLARSKANSGWQNTYDSHARISLSQYNLIKLVGDHYHLDILGEQLASMFDDDARLTAPREDYIALTYQMITTWHQSNDDYDIHPGLLILKWMLEPQLNGFITSQDVAHIFNDAENKKDTQYLSFVDRIVEFRNSGTLYTKDELKKTYTLLTGYVKWDIFDLDEAASDSLIKTVKMKPDFLQYCKKQLRKNEEEVLNDSQFTSLIEETDDFKGKIEEYGERYGESGRVVVTYETRVSQIQAAFRNRLLSSFAHKCMMCDISNTEMLIGSHIKRDSECTSISEKIDTNNGFLLCANHDKLFDRYLISFDAFTGKILISSQLTEDERNICLLDDNYALSEELLTPERTSYLIWHNSEFWKKENGDR